MAFAGFTNLELKVIALMVSGLKGSEIAKQLGIGRQLVYNALWSACIKERRGAPDAVGDAMGLRQPLSAETSETRPYPGKPVKLGPNQRRRQPA